LAWLARLPQVVGELQQRWSLTLDAPVDCAEASCAWVARAKRTDGTSAILKLGMPHMEGEDEIAGLRFWNGEPTVRLLEAQEELGGMLLECCEPGSALRAVPESEQDAVIAGLLRRLWREPPTLHSFRSLSEMTAFWAKHTLSAAERWPDAGLVRAGLELFEQLPRSEPQRVLLATDLHAGNVLRAQREPWLVIDPKPFIGDPAYDATQHLFNTPGRLQSDPDGTMKRFADLLGLDHQRIRLWMFARAAAEPGNNWKWLPFARTIAP
jgi:streptomycin 6-kinase